MIFTLVRKLLHDVRVPLIAVMVLLASFQCLWVKITQRITGQLVPLLMGLASAWPVSKQEVENVLFEGPGQIMRTMMGGENIGLDRAQDMLTIGYVHPLVQTILCVWAIGRAARAVAGEIDSGTMELLLAQPIRRYQVILAHFLVDCLTIPLLCLSMWAGTSLGSQVVGPIGINADELKRLPFPVHVDPAALQLDAWAFGPSLWNVGALLFAVSGYTLFLSAMGRHQWRVLGTAVFITLIMFLINLLGQLWDQIAVLRPFTVFYYYQPQQIILHQRWTVNFKSVWSTSLAPHSVNVLVVLFVIGFAGYGLAWFRFCKRDLPAPL
jgi:ABC-2 type transport system permease protein